MCGSLKLQYIDFKNTPEDWPWVHFMDTVIVSHCYIRCVVGNVNLPNWADLLVGREDFALPIRSQMLPIQCKVQNGCCHLAATNKSAQCLSEKLRKLSAVMGSKTKNTDFNQCLS